MSKPYEEMTDEELEELTEQALREHEAGISPFRPQGELALRTIPTLPLSMRVPADVMERIRAAAAARDLEHERLINRWLEEAVERDAQCGASCSATLHLTPEQTARLLKSGHLDIRIELG